ncbi:MAG: hypothetical protein WA376_02360, partial [Terrimicrobiaceae bacterium]
ALRAFVAGQFLALDHAHKVAGRLDLEHLLFLEANATALLSAAHAEPLLALHGNDLLAPWQMLGQGVAPGMLALREALSPRRDLGFLFDLLRVDSRLELQELDLSGAELLALRAILLYQYRPCLILPLRLQQVACALVSCSARSPVPWPFAPLP